MPRKTVSKRRTRVKARARAKRVSRRRKGGECGDITKHEDNHHCVEAGCDPLKCAKYYRASKPHKSVDEIALFNKYMKNLALRKQNARDDRRASRAASRTASNNPHTSNLIPTLNADNWRRFTESSSDDE
jgi:hypothetical protein